MDEAKTRARDVSDAARARSAGKKAPTKKKPTAKKKAPTKKKAASSKPAPKQKAPASKKAPTKKKPAAAKAAAKPKAAPKKAVTKKPAAKPKAPAKPAPASKKPGSQGAPPKKKASPKKPSPAADDAPRAVEPTEMTPETRPRKDVQDVAAEAKEGNRRKPNKPVLIEEDDLSPVRSSKTSGPLVRVTGTSTRPPAEASRVGTPAVLAPGEAPPPPSPVHRSGLPPEVAPDPSILRLDDNRGALSAHGYRLVLLHPESLIEIQMALEEKVGLEAGQMIFRGGYVIGLREARRMKDSELTEEEIVKNVASRCSAHGWGIFQVESLDLWRHELIFRVDHSPFAYAYGKASTGVDHLIRGVFSGVCEVIFDKKVVATESMCRAMGDAYCQFMVG